MSKTAAFKLAARLIVGAGTTTISHSIIRNNVEPTNLFQQISTGLASAVIGSMASEATRAHTDAQIDAAINLWNSRTEETPETEPQPA